MRGASAGKTMYVIPYLMAPPGSPLEQYAAGVELTDNRPVVLHMIRMARVGVQYVNNLADPNASSAPCTSPATSRTSARARPTTSATSSRSPTSARSCTSARRTAATRCSARSPTACARRSYDGWAAGKFLVEQFMLLGITDKETGKKYHICGGFPSASGKTNLAMTLAPDALGDRYHVEFYGDDIAWLWVDPDDGRLYGMNPENGVFGVAKDTNERTNPDRARLHPAAARRRCSPTSPRTRKPTRSGGRARRPTRPPTSPAGATGRAT